MKTYQLKIEDNLFPELKKILGLLPKNSVKLYHQNGYEICIDDHDVELTDELKAALDEGVDSLDRGEGIPHEKVLHELRTKYPNLDFNT
ncbi:MAG TPA: hypothetical protein PLK12_00895 [Prolixibacteraceae bacterium]|nr:hypothetical protein [Prolixibacteraceae bacterium]